ncbi:MAG: hypothetical protein JW856_03995 [Dehalococcoidales bacterium]|nr:hypothetical protein [Dehalococcoidales bacterium]
MKILPVFGKNKGDKSLAIFHGESATSSIESAVTAYQGPSIIAAGADAGSVALLTAALNLALSALLIKVPTLAEKQNNLKRTTISIAIINTITWLPVVLVLLLFSKLNPYLLIGLWVLNMVPSILVGPLRDNWVANLIPSEKVGRYLSWRAAIASTLYLGISYLMAFILDKAGSGSYHGYAIVTAIALFGALASTVFYGKIRQSQSQTAVPKAEAFGFLSFLKETRHSHLGTFIIFMALFTFAVNLSSPLVAAYMITNLKFSYMAYFAMISCEYIARIISLSYWGKLVDKSGSLNVMMKVTYFIPFVPVLWMFSRNIFYLGAVQLFAGVVWAAFDLSAQAFLYKATPKEQRLRYISYQRSLTTLSVAIGAISGALLLRNIFPVFGSQILGVFLVSGVLRMVVARVMLPRLQPGAIPDAIVHEELAVELARFNMANRDGLYYHPERWSRFAKPVAAFGAAIGKTMNKLVMPGQSGLYYNRQKWADYASEMQPSVVQVNDDTTDKDGLYYNKKARAGYMGQTSAIRSQFGGDAAVGNSAIKNQQPVRKGLFYDTEKWTDYLKQSLVLNATTARTGGDFTPVRQPIFYHPEVWSQYQKRTGLSREFVSKANMASTRQPLLYHPEEWGRFIDPAMVRIGRKSAIGSTVTRQGTFARQGQRALPVRHLPAENLYQRTKHIKISPSLA